MIREQDVLELFDTYIDQTMPGMSRCRSVGQRRHLTKAKHKKTWCRSCNG